MNPFDAVGRVTARIATLTSVLRAREEEQEMLARHGAPIAVIEDRIQARADGLESVLTRLEGAVK